MRIPDTLLSLADYGIIDEVLRPLMSGKEAQIYLVRCNDELRVAKVYKEAQNRSFKNRAEYTEGRTVRNSRDQRAMNKGSRHGRAQTEAAWRTTEVDMIYRLRAAGVRVPTPYHFIDGVLVMELVTDEQGQPAPRLGDVVLDQDSAQRVYDSLLAEVVRMLAAGVVHGDLSDFNVLMGPDGPVVIDFPQAVDASSNQNARKLLLRDVDNLHRFMQRFAPERSAPPYAQEMWALYERGELTADTKLTGRYKPAERKVSTDAVLGLISDAVRDERRRRGQLGLSMKGAGELDSGDAPARETAQKPLSRYQQKRQAQVAATLALKAAAASAPMASKEPQSEPRDRSHGQHTRARHGHGDARTRSAQGGGEARQQASHQTRQHGGRDVRQQGPHDGRQHGGRDSRQRGPHEARQHGGHTQSAHQVRQHPARDTRPHGAQERHHHGSHEARQQGAQASRHHGSHESRSQGSHESRPQRSHDPRSHGAHAQHPRKNDGPSRAAQDQPRAAQTHGAPATRPHPSRETHARDAGRQRQAGGQPRAHTEAQQEAAPRHASTSQTGRVKPRPRSAE